MITPKPKSKRYSLGRFSIPVRWIDSTFFATVRHSRNPVSVHWLLHLDLTQWQKWTAHYGIQTICFYSFFFHWRKLPQSSIRVSVRDLVRIEYKLLLWKQTPQNGIGSSWGKFRGYFLLSFQSYKWSKMLFLIWPGLVISLGLIEISSLSPSVIVTSIRPPPPNNKISKLTARTWSWVDIFKPFVAYFCYFTSECST